LLNRYKDKANVIIPAKKAVVLIAFSLLINIMIIAPISGRNIVVESIGKSR
jgi:uncharacterized membrane protein